MRQPLRVAAVFAAALMLLGAAPAQDHKHQDKIDRANGTIADFKHDDETMNKWFENAVGYAVFPSIGKGGFGIGGAGVDAKHVVAGDQRGQ